MDNIGILDPNGINKNPLTGEEYSEQYKKLAEKWSQFPAYENAKETIQKIKDHQIILITSGTGSGKTVLIPKFTLHAFNYDAKIAITLPKQIITQSAAIFSAKTLDVEPVGKIVGYKYKGSDKSKHNKDNKLLYATDGTIVAQLLKDPKLSNFNAVIVDEAHERKVQIDFLLYLLRQTTSLRPEFKVIIMSATINEKIFIDYFKKFQFIHIDIGGKTNYPIESIFLEKSLEGSKDYFEYGIKIIKDIIETTDQGDILFFVPSIMDTFDGCRKISLESNKNICFEVYSGMDEKRQELAQEKDLYKQKYTSATRKIIFATNVAESSLTIDGIKYVIDSGYEIFGSYNPQKRAKILERKLISQAQVKQRKGRAGRTESGICYHLYTQKDFDTMLPFPEPAIRINNIYGECLRLLNLEYIGTIGNLVEILEQFIEPPRRVYIDDAISQLNDLDLVKNDRITNLGTLIANTQLDPNQGVTCYVAYRLNCSKEVIAILAMIDAMKNNISELFTLPSDLLEPEIDSSNDKQLKKLTDKFMNVKKTLLDDSGDHISILKIFMKYLKLKDNLGKLDEWTYKFFLKRKTLERANKYYRKIRNTIRMNFKDVGNEQKVISENSLYNRVIASIMYGFKLNFASYDENEKVYRTDRVNNAKISKNSWLNFVKDKKKQVVYHELFIGGGRTELTIVSNISKNAKKIYDLRLI